jgi:putative addiction module killer protein
VPEIRQTTTFREWLRTLRDRAAVLRIADRIQRMAQGNMGDVKPVGSGVSELRLDFGPGYRVYFTRRGPTIYLLLCGGDKSTQARDIEIAKRLAKEI